MNASAGRGRAWLWAVGAAATAVLIAVAVAAIVSSNSARTPSAPTPPEPTSTAQARAVSDFLSAYVTGDTQAIERHVTARSRPWTAPSPHLPAGISAQDAASALVPTRDGDSLVIDVPFVATLRLTGDGRAPRGTVAVVVNRNGSPARTVSVGVVFDAGRWLLDTIGGAPAAQGIARLAP